MSGSSRLTTSAAGQSGQGPDSGVPLAADGGPHKDASAPDMSDDAGPATNPVPPAAPGLEASDEVFRDDLLRTYSLTIAPSDWDLLQKTATDEIYVPGVLSVESQMLGKVGVRYKGSYTLNSCFMDGKQICRKASMKLKLDEYDSELRYFGLKKLNFHASQNDHSHLHERVSYKMFRDFDVLAPRSVHARLMINGKYAGLFNLTEEVDGRFTDFHFSGPEGQGNLYKEVWPSSSQDPAYYTAAQQTNKGAPVAKITRFANELAGSQRAALGEVVTRWMDPDYTLRYLAVHTAIKHWDGPLTFWCSVEKGCVNHNYFLYESPSRDRISIIAWDMDNTFYDDVQTDQADVPEWYEATNGCVRDGSVQFLAPGCDRLVQGFQQLGLDKFRAAMAKLLAGPYQVAPIQADIDRWAKQIDEAIKTDPNGPDYEDWKGNVAGFRAAIATFRTRAKVVRDAKSP